MSGPSLLIECTDSTAVDLGFSEGGLLLYCVRSARKKILRPHPLLVKPCPFSIILERDFLLYLSIDPFSIKIYAKAC